MQTKRLWPYLWPLLVAWPVLAPGQIGTPGVVLSGTQLAAGYDMGVNSSGGSTDWLSIDPSNSLRMAYPPNQEWGAVFITVGKPVAPPRPSLDFSDYHFLIVELKGPAGGQLQAGIKAAADPDTGTEIKQTVDLTGDWQTQVFPLGGFAGEELGHLYVVCEFVFSGSSPLTTYVRSVRYVKSLSPGGAAVSLRAQGGSQLGLYINGGAVDQASVYRGERGLHIAVLHEITCEVEELRRFDTWVFGPDKPAPAILDFVNSIPDGRIVFAAVTGYNTIPNSVVQTFQVVFGTEAMNSASGYNSWAMIARKGGGTAIAESIQVSSSAYGTQSVADAKITIGVPTSDTTPPSAAVRINGGALETSDNRATLDLSGTVDLGSGMSPGGKMQFSNDGHTWSLAKDFQASATWYLDRGSGSRQVFARFRDRDGNWSATVTRDINLIDTGSLRRFPDPAVDNMCMDESGAIYELAAGAARVSRDGALTWSSPAAVLPPGGYQNPLIGCGGGAVIVLAPVRSLDSPRGLLVNTSPDYGATWMSAASILTAGGPIQNYTFSSVGNAVYAIWVEGERGSMRLMVNASLDFGATWRSQVFVVTSPDSGMASSDFAATVADDGSLLVLWSAANGDVLLRRSTDQATTFLPPQILGNSGSDPGYPYLLSIGGGEVYAAWSRYSFSFRHSVDAGASWSLPVASGSAPCYWNSTFLPTVSSQLFLSCMADESFTSPGSSSLYFNRTSRAGGGWLGPVRINSNAYRETGSVFGVPDVDVSLIDARESTVVLAWEDARSKVDGDAKGYDIYWTISNDYGATWPVQNTRLTGSFPFGAAQLWWLALGPDRKSYTFWKQGSAMYLDIRPVAGQAPMAAAQASIREQVRAAETRNRGGLRVEPAGRHAPTRTWTPDSPPSRAERRN